MMVPGEEGMSGSTRNDVGAGDGASGVPFHFQQGIGGRGRGRLERFGHPPARPNMKKKDEGAQVLSRGVRNFRTFLKSLAGRFRNKEGDAPGNGGREGNMLVGLDKQERMFFRLPTALEAWYRFIQEEPAYGVEAVPRRGIVENLSGGGLLLKTEEPPVELVGDLLSGRIGLALHLDLPDGPLDALGRVVWIEGEGRVGSDVCMGVGFQEITSTDRDRLIRTVIQAFSG